MEVLKQKIIEQPFYKSSKEVFGYLNYTFWIVTTCLQTSRNTEDTEPDTSRLHARTIL